MVQKYWYLPSQRKNDSWKLICDPRIVHIGRLSGMLLAPRSTFFSFRQARRRCQSRLNKHLGDLCVLLGQHEAALKYYSQATDQLKSANDWLWMAAALEGQCCASINASHPRRRENDEQEGQTVDVEIKEKRRLTLKRNSRKSPSRSRASQLMSNDEIVSTYEKALVEYSKVETWLVIVDVRGSGWLWFSSGMRLWWKETVVFVVLGISLSSRFLFVFWFCGLFSLV